jgi:hypothetical protein
MIMGTTHYDVICIRAWPEKGYKKGTEYQAKKNNPQRPWWVGTSGTGGHHISDDDYKKHFEVKKSVIP